MDRETALRNTLASLNRRFGGIDIKQLDELKPVRESVVSTGIIGLDAALGTGGIRKGSIVEISAPESAGKTTLALHMCRQFQKLDRPVLYIDSERTLTRETIEGTGVKPENFYLMHADTLETALETCRTAALNGAFSAVVVDSLTGLVPKEQAEGDVGGTYTGLASRIMSETLPVLTALLDNSGCTLIITSQLREKAEAAYGSREYSPGGRALKYYASVRLDIRRIESIKHGGMPAGYRTRAKAVKNKTAAPYREAEFDIMFGHGISAEGDVLDQAVEKNIIEKYSAWYLYDGKKIGQGRENAKQYLREHPLEMEEISKKLREMLLTA